MADYSTIYSLLKGKSFTEILSDRELIQVHDAITEILAHYSLVPRDENTYEYGYSKPRGSGHVIAVIGDKQAFTDYKFDVENSLTHPNRRYFKRPKDTRQWEEILTEN